MSAVEVKVMELITAERYERFKAVNELWAKLDEMQMEFQRRTSPASPCDVKAAAASAKFLPATSEATATGIEGAPRMRSSQEERLDSLELQIMTLKAGCNSIAAPSGQPAYDLVDRMESLRLVTERTQGEVDSLEKRDERLESILRKTQGTIVELRNALLLQTVKASRFALKALRMNAEEQEQAWVALVATEEKLRMPSSRGPASHPLLAESLTE